MSYLGNVYLESINVMQFSPLVSVLALRLWSDERILVESEQTLFEIIQWFIIISRSSNSSSSSSIVKDLLRNYTFLQKFVRHNLKIRAIDMFIIADLKQNFMNNLWMCL